MNLSRVNGSRAVVLVELRRPRRSWWREPDGVLRVTGTTVVCLGLVLVGLIVLGHRPPRALLAASWLCVGVSVLVWPLGRPCAGCGRWLQHGLACPRRRP